MSKRAGDPGYAPGWCIYYRASSYETCEVGVNYAELNGGSTNGMIHTLPCFIKHPDPTAYRRVKCPAFRPPTPEEVRLHQAWAADRVRKMLLAMEALAPHRKRGNAVVIECPVCKGRLHATFAGSKAHAHAKCETEGCVSWIE